MYDKSCHAFSIERQVQHPEFLVVKAWNFSINCIGSLRSKQFIYRYIFIYIIYIFARYFVYVLRLNYESFGLYPINILYLRRV